MALKEQANKHKSPRNQSGLLRDGVPLENGAVQQLGQFKANKGEKQVHR